MRSIALTLILPLLAVLCLAPMQIQATETFTWGHPKPQGNSVHNMAFQGDNNGWAVCGSATVLATTDGGTSWQVVYGPYPELGEMNDVAVLADGTLVVVGEGIFRSTDGGASWTPIASPTAAELLDITEIPGGDLSACGDEGAVLISNDGGLTWTDVGLAAGLGRHHLWRSPTEGYVVGEQISHRTTDGGATWTQMTDFANFWYNEIYFRDELRGVIVEDFATWRTEDGGETWTEFFAPERPLYRHRTVVLTPDHLLAVTIFEGGELWESFDGGETWTQLQYLNVIGFPTLTKTNSGRVHWASNMGHLFWSDDFGQTIEEASTKLTPGAPSAPIDTFVLRPDGVLFAANQPSFSNETEAWLRSDDGGLNWFLPANTPGLRWVREAMFLDNSLGLASWGYRVRLTDDGGETWTAADLPTNQSIWGVALVAADRYYLATTHSNGGGDLLLSTDGGQTWTAVANGLPAGQLYASSINFTDADTGYVAGLVNNVPRIYRTVDGGQSWQLRPGQGLPGLASDMHWLDGNTGLLTVYQTDFAGLYRSEDGGATWTSLFDQRLLEVDFRNELAGVAYGNNSHTYIRTEDGGLTWTSYDSPFSGPGAGIHSGRLASAASRDDGWVLGGYGGRIMVVMDNTLSAVDASPSLVPGSGSRFLAATPNPFNPSTSIAFELDQSGSARVTVYDLAGRRVRVLVQKNLPQGRHEVQWDGTDTTGAIVAAGVYLVRVDGATGPGFGKVVLAK